MRFILNFSEAGPEFSGPVISQLLYYILQRFMKRRNIFADNFPDEPEVYPLIIVDNTIPQSIHLPPRDFRVIPYKFIVCGAA